VKLHQPRHLDQAQFGRAGDGRTTADTVNGDKEKAVFVDNRHDLPAPWLKVGIFFRNWRRNAIQKAMP
jgi:hypothetical protein